MSTRPHQEFVPLAQMPQGALRFDTLWELEAGRVPGFYCFWWALGTIADIYPLEARIVFDEAV